MTAWVWKPYVARRHLTLIHGTRHAGKSYVAMMIAAAVVDGVTLAGIPAAKGAIAYLDRQNDPFSVVKPRLNGNGCRNQQDFIHVGDSFRADNTEEHNRLSRMIGRLDLDLVVFDNIFTHSMRKVVALQQIAALAKFHSCAMVVVMDDSDMTASCKNPASVVVNVEQRGALRSISIRKGLSNRSMEPKHFHIEPNASNKYRSKLVWKSDQSAHACEGI